MLRYSNEIFSTVISDTIGKNSKKALKRKKLLHIMVGSTIWVSLAQNQRIVVLVLSGIESLRKRILQVETKRFLPECHVVSDFSHPGK